MFDLKNVEEQSAGGNGLYIYPGIREVVLSKWTKGTSTQKGTPYIGVKFLTLEAQKTGGVDPKEFPIYITESSMTLSLARIKHIVTKITTEEAFASKSPADLDEMVDHLNDISRGGKLRIKFTGRMYKNANGEAKEAAELPLSKFAEAIEEGASYPVMEVTELVYDKNNPKDLKPLEEDSTSEGVIGGPAGPAPSVAW